jgi:hypothetical protein
MSGARGITSRQGPVTGMGLSNNALLIGASIDQTSCRFVCVRVARIYDGNLFETPRAQSLEAQLESQIVIATQNVVRPRLSLSNRSADDRRFLVEGIVDAASDIDAAIEFVGERGIEQVIARYTRSWARWTCDRGDVVHLRQVPPAHAEFDTGQPIRQGS